jgi:hypothetical protein
MRALITSSTLIRNAYRWWFGNRWWFHISHGKLHRFFLSFVLAFCQICFHNKSQEIIVVVDIISSMASCIHSIFFGSFVLCRIYIYNMIQETIIDAIGMLLQIENSINVVIFARTFLWFILNHYNFLLKLWSAWTLIGLLWCLVILYVRDDLKNNVFCQSFFG